MIGRSCLVGPSFTSRRTEDQKHPFSTVHQRMADGQGQKALYFLGLPYGWVSFDVSLRSNRKDTSDRSRSLIHVASPQPLEREEYVNV